MTGMGAPTSMRIGQLSQATGVSRRSLRYYEEQGLLSPRRSDAGQRLFGAEDVERVIRIQHLFAAGFCSRVIHDLLPEIINPDSADPVALAENLEAARRRLEAEKREIDRELEELEALRTQLGLAPGIPVGLAPDTHVRAQDRSHDSHDSDGPAPVAPPAPPDHRGRRLR